MTTNGLLTTAEAQAVLQCVRTQLYRWHKAGLLTGRLRRGRVTRWEWDEAPVLALAAHIGPRQEGHARRVKLPS